MSFIVIIGVITTIIGLIGLGLCVRKAVTMRRAKMDDATASKELGRLSALHMASVGVAFLGLMLLVVGLLIG